MKMSSTALFNEFAKDFYTPPQEDTGAAMAEVMEGKLSNLLDQFQNRLNESLEAINRPNMVEEINNTSETVESEIEAPEEPEIPDFKQMIEEVNMDA